MFVGADLAPGVVKGQAAAGDRQLPIMQNLPQGISNAPFCEDQWQQEIIANFARRWWRACCWSSLVLVLLYHRFVSPLVNMGSLFLAPFGGLLALAIAGQLAIPCRCSLYF